MLLDHRGPASPLEERLLRMFPPPVIATPTIVPLGKAIQAHDRRTKVSDPPVTGRGDFAAATFTIAYSP
jgi:hypothetical protein